MFKRYTGFFFEQENFLFKLLLGAVAVLWLVPAFSPLWCDEGITYWIINCGWAQALHRALSFQEWSVLYFMLEKAFMTVGGSSGFMLRLPSLIAAAAAVRAVYLLAKRLGGARAGLPAALVLSVSAAAVAHAAEARPYALTLACVTISTLYLVKTLDDGRPRDAAVYALTAALAAYMQLLSAAVLAVHLLYWARRRFVDKDAAGVFPAALAGTAALMLPLLIPARSIITRRADLMFATYPHVLEFIFYAFPKPLLLGAAFGFLLTRPALPSRKEFKELPASALTLALGLALLPPLIFFCGGYLMHARVWVPRYFVYSQAGTALCAGLLLGMFRPESALRTTAACIVAAVLCSHTSFPPFYEDWRKAADYSSKNVAQLGAGVALVSPYIESMRPDWRADPEKAAYLAAPLNYYPAGAAPALLPLNLSPENKDQVAVTLKAAVRGRDSLVLMTVGSPEYNDFIEKCLATDGFSVKERSGMKKMPDVTLYARTLI